MADASVPRLRTHRTDRPLLQGSTRLAHRGSKSTVAVAIGFKAMHRRWEGGRSGSHSRGAQVADAAEMPEQQAGRFMREE